MVPTVVRNRIEEIDLLPQTILDQIPADEFQAFDVALLLQQEARLRSQTAADSRGLLTWLGKAFTPHLHLLAVSEGTNRIMHQASKALHGLDVNEETLKQYQSADLADRATLLSALSSDILLGNILDEKHFQPEVRAIPISIAEANDYDFQGFLEANPITDPDTYNYFLDHVIKSLETGVYLDKTKEQGKQTSILYFTPQFRQTLRKEFERIHQEHQQRDTTVSTEKFIKNQTTKYKLKTRRVEPSVRFNPGEYPFKRWLKVLGGQISPAIQEQEYLRYIQHPDHTQNKGKKFVHSLAAALVFVGIPTLPLITGKALGLVSPVFLPITVGLMGAVTYARAKVMAFTSGQLQEAQVVVYGENQKAGGWLSWIDAGRRYLGSGRFNNVHEQGKVASFRDTFLTALNSQTVSDNVFETLAQYKALERETVKQNHNFLHGIGEVNKEIGRIRLLAIRLESELFEDTEKVELETRVRKIQKEMAGRHERLFNELEQASTSVARMAGVFSALLTFIGIELATKAYAGRFYIPFRGFFENVDSDALTLSAAGVPNGGPVEAPIIGSEPATILVTKEFNGAPIQLPEGVYISPNEQAGFVDFQYIDPVNPSNTDSVTDIPVKAGSIDFSNQKLQDFLGRRGYTYSSSLVPVSVDEVKIGNTTFKVAQENLVLPTDRNGNLTPDAIKALEQQGVRASRGEVLTNFYDTVPTEKGKVVVPKGWDAIVEGNDVRVFTNNGNPIRIPLKPDGTPDYFSSGVEAAYSKHGIKIGQQTIGQTQELVSLSSPETLPQTTSQELNQLGYTLIKPGDAIHNSGPHELGLEAFIDNSTGSREISTHDLMHGLQLQQGESIRLVPTGELKELLEKRGTDNIRVFTGIHSVTANPELDAHRATDILLGSDAANDISIDSNTLEVRIDNQTLHNGTALGLGAFNEEGKFETLASLCVKEGDEVKVAVPRTEVAPTFATEVQTYNLDSTLQRFEIKDVQIAERPVFDVQVQVESEVQIVELPQEIALWPIPFAPLAAIIPAILTGGSIKVATSPTNTPLVLRNTHVTYTDITSLELDDALRQREHMVYVDGEIDNLDMVLNTRERELNKMRDTGVITDEFYNQMYERIEHLRLYSISRDSTTINELKYWYDIRGKVEDIENTILIGRFNATDLKLHISGVRNNLKQTVHMYNKNLFDSLNKRLSVIETTLGNLTRDKGQNINILIQLQNQLIKLRKGTITHST